MFARGACPPPGRGIVSSGGRVVGSLAALPLSAPVHRPAESEMPRSAVSRLVWERGRVDDAVVRVRRLREDVRGRRFSLCEVPQLRRRLLTRPVARVRVREVRGEVLDGEDKSPSLGSGRLLHVRWAVPRLRRGAARPLCTPHEGPPRTEEDDYNEAFDAAVKLEIEYGQIREDLWATALVEAGGSEDAARSVYFRLRVEQLKAAYRRPWAEGE